MLVMSRGALSAGQAETYYEEKYSQDDYYTEEHRVAGQWFGQGADAWGSPVKSIPKIFVPYYTVNGREPPKFSCATPTDELHGGLDGTRPLTRPSQSAFRHWLAETLR